MSFAPCRWFLILFAAFAGAPLYANPPELTYLFPAGGRQGTTVSVRVGGLFLYQRCGFAVEGEGIAASAEATSMPTLWIEGPLLPIPESQRQEDYPRDMAATIRVDAKAPLGLRPARVWTAEGVASGPLFEVGDLPEMIEEEIAGDPLPVEVRLPVTINGRIFPRQDIDVWTVQARKGETITCRVRAAALNSPLDARLNVLGPDGLLVAEKDDTTGPDPTLSFTAARDGTYQVRVDDAGLLGSQAHVYRLTITKGEDLRRVYPLGGKRGETSKFQMFGPGLSGRRIDIALPDAAGEHVHRVALGDRQSAPFVLDVDELPEHLEPEAGASSANPIAIPAIVNGVIAKPGEEDRWKFQAKKGETLALSLRASRLGSPLVGVLTVLDLNDKVLARAEGTGKEIDPTLTFKPPADGTYVVQVTDRFSSRGGDDFAYRLRLAPSAPDFAIALTGQVVNIPRGGQAKVRVEISREVGFAGLVHLHAEGLPRGVRMEGNPQIKPNQKQIDLLFKADANAPTDIARITITGKAELDGTMPTRRAKFAGPPGTPACEELTLAVTLPVPFKLISEYRMQWNARGGVLRKHYRIERNGYGGPLEVRLADRQARHLQGVTGAAMTVAPDVNEFDYLVQLPPWMETGRTCRVCVMAVGKVRDGDREHEVSFSASGQNDQMVTVIETGRLAVEAGHSSLPVNAGQEVTLPIRIARGKGLTGPARIELILPRHMRGIHTESVVIKTDDVQGALTVRFDRRVRGPFNMPVTVRATITEADGPVVGETQIEFVAGSP